MNYRSRANRWYRLTPLGCSADAENARCSPNASLRPVPACFSLLVFVCLCVCSSWCGGSVCVWRIHTNHPSVERLGSDGAPSSPFWAKATFQSWLLGPPSRPWKGKIVDLQPGAVPHNVSGSEAFAPDPADPEIDTRASQPHRETEKTSTSDHSLTHSAPCTARDRARGCLFGPGFWPKVCV